MSEEADRYLERLEGMRGAMILKKDGSILASKLPDDRDTKDIAKKALGLMESTGEYIRRAGGTKTINVVVSDSDGLLAVAQKGDLTIVGIFGSEFDSDSASSRIVKAALGLKDLVGN